MYVRLMTKTSATEEWKCVLNYVTEVSLVFFFSFLLCKFFCVAVKCYNKNIDFVNSINVVFHLELRPIPPNVLFDATVRWVAMRSFSQMWEVSYHLYVCVVCSGSRQFRWFDHYVTFLVSHSTCPFLHFCTNSSRRLSHPSPNWFAVYLISLL